MVTIFVSIVLAVSLYLVLKSLSKPMTGLKKAAEAVENGDYSTRADEKGTDEFADLAKSFNSMLNRINDQMVQLDNESKRKQTLVDNMAHELRTPLTSIRGYADILEKANITEKNRIMAAKYISSESARLQRISEVMLNSALLRETDVEISCVNIAEILTETVQKFKYVSEQAGVQLVTSIKDSCIVCNRDLLAILFGNLIDNAIKACSEGGRVEIDNNLKTVRIKDNGRGMTKEQTEHITEPFYRTDKVRSRSEGGAGLGLSICAQIVKAHNAEMTFESEVGVGTCVTVSFQEIDD